jgi:excisionase family DNA binding protein
MKTRRTENNDERLAFKVAEAAVACRVSKPTMLKLVHSGRVQATRVGRRILISREALQDFLNGGARNETRP